jgi:hypothetical protein
MKTININVFKGISVLAVGAMLLGIFMFEAHALKIIYLATLVVLISLYVRRDTSTNILNHNIAVTTALGVLVYVGVAYITSSTEDTVMMQNGVMGAGLLVAIGYVYEQYQKGNVEVNSYEITKIPKWNVFRDHHEEQGNDVINLIASGVSYDEAIQLMRKVYAEGETPHATSERQYRGQLPQMDHSGTYIGDKYKYMAHDAPFTIE